MITDNGRLQQLRLIGGEATTFADTFVVGASVYNIPNEAKDISMPWGYFPITDSVIDYENKQVLFYGTIPADLAGMVREIGLSYTGGAEINRLNPTHFSYLFGNSEPWSVTDSGDISFVSEDSDLGAQNLLWTNAKKDQRVFLLDESGMNFNGVDTIKLKIHASKPAQIGFGLAVSDTSFIGVNADLVAGDNFIEKKISEFERTEDFAMDKVVLIMIESHTDNVDFDLDGLLLINSNIGGLVARETILPVKKMAGSTMEIEMAVAI